MLISMLAQTELLARLDLPVLRRRVWTQAVLGCVLAVGAVPFALAEGSAPGTHERAQGYLGVEFHDLADDQVNALRLQGPHGAEITMVDHDGPAGKAGLQPHDIVLQINGQNIDHADELRRKIRESSPGAAVSLSILRQGRAMTVEAKLANRQDVERMAWQRMTSPEPPAPSDEVQSILIERFTVEEPAPKPQAHGQSFIGSVLRTTPYTGATLETMEPQLAGFFGAPPKTGLLVHGVEANSPAALAGLRAGDVVLKMDASNVASTSDWAKHLRANKGQAVSLTVLRDKHEVTLTLAPDLKKHSLLEWPKLF